LYPALENPTIPLTKEGEVMVEKAAEKLKNLASGDPKGKIDLIFASDFLRTRQTAGIVAKKLGLEVNLDKRLRDINLGEFHGKPVQEYKNFFSEKKERFEKRTPGGENWNDVKKRLSEFLAEVENKYQGKNILLVSHADPIWLLYGLIKGFKTEDEFLAVRGTEIYPGVGQLIIV